MTPEIWTLKDVAKFLRVSDEDVENLVKESKIPYFLVGEAIRFRKDEVTNWATGGAAMTLPRLRTILAQNTRGEEQNGAYHATRESCL